MATTRIKDKVSELVNSQLPEFIRSDYTTFVAFLQYYYQFLEQDQGALELVQNARQYSDIDQTTESFVNYFLTNYAKDLPVSLLVNKPLLIKKIKGLYAAKGSTLSIETLFKVLYDTVAVTNHPYDYVLRPSDGNWNQRSSIRVYLTSGSVESITDRFLNLTKNNIEYSAAITRVKSISSDLYEIFYNSRSNVPFEINDEVSVNTSTSTIFTGTVKPTTTSYQISYGGTGFRVGEVFNINVGGTDTVVRVTRVGTNGSIQTLKFINFGYNYSSNITISLSVETGAVSSTKYFTTNTGGFQESVTLVSIHSNVDVNRYFDSDYVTPFAYTGNLLSSTTTTSQLTTSATTASASNPADAIISFNIGAIARYPGEYIATPGFLSEPDVRLQDQYLYQPFAYQVESELDISVFYDIVKKLVHQAGTNLFVNRVLTTIANVSANVEVVSSKNVFTQLNSVFNILDSRVYQLQKPLANVLSISDNFISLDVYKPVSDTVTISDSFNLIKYLESFSDNVTVLESFNFVTGSNLSDNQSLSDELLQVFGKNIDNNLSNVSITDSGSGIIVDYATDYFNEIYAGTPVITF